MGAYARVLYIGGFALKEASRGARLLAELARAGHAVRGIDAALGEADLAARIASAAHAFNPTLALWDAPAPSGAGAPAVRAALAGAGCAVAALGAGPLEAEAAAGALGAGLSFAWGLPGDEGSVPAPAVAGACYRALRCAGSPAAGRSGVARAASACENPVHIFKSSRYAAMRAGDGAGTLADAALRAAEGCLVLAEEGLAASWGLGPQDAPLAFAPGALEDEVARLDADPEARAAALTRQEALPWAAPAPGALAAWLKGADRRAREAGWPPVLAYADPARKFVVYGWIGANNYGDDLLLRTAIDKVSRRWPNARFVCMGADAATLERDFGVEATDPVPGRALDLALTGASAVICLGGLIFDDPSQRTEGAGEFALRPHAEPGFQATMALSARIRGVPTVYMSLGSGPMSDPAVQAALRLHALAGTLFLPRDEETRRMLVAGGADPSRVRLRSDIVLAAGGYVRATAAAEPPHGLAPGSYFAVALRAWPRAPRDLAASMAALIAEAARQSGLMPVLVPFDADDARIHAEVAALLEARGAACLDLPERLAEPDLLALLMGSAFGVSMRLHASIIHHLLGKPALGVDYNSKVGAYFRRMGQQDVLVPMDVDGEGCARSVSALLGDAQGRAAAVAEAAAHARELADEAFEDLFRAVEGGFAGVPTPLPQETACYPRLGSALERDLAFERDRASALDASLAAERARAEAAEARVRDLEGSHSYRLGRAITAVPARVRDALRGR